MARTTSLLLAVVLVVAGCSSKPRVIVGSKNFTEQTLLGELIAQHIEASTDLTVERRLNLGGTLLAHEAVKQGKIDLYPEYTGTALTAVLKQQISRDPSEVLRSVREGYAPYALAWLDPLGFDNTFAMVIRGDVSRQNGLRSLSNAAARVRPWRLGVGYEFIERPDGLKGLLKTYGLRLDGDPVSMDLGLLYPALETDRIEMAAASATDGRLADNQFTVLEDDRSYFPPYQCAIVVRQEALARYPEFRRALQTLSGKISDVNMRKMNAAVDRDHRSASDVAREFLAGKD